MYFYWRYLMVESVRAKRDELIEKYEKDFGALDAFSKEEADAIRLKLTLRAKALVKQEAHKEAVKVLVNFATAYASADEQPEVMEAVRTLTTQPKRTRETLTHKGAPTPRGVIAIAFNNVGEHVSEADIFSKYRMGRGEMRGAIKLALQKASPEERKWIMFNPESESYTLVEIGPNPPANWTGYVPLSVGKSAPVQ
jgi:hypothetical protein